MLSSRLEVLEAQVDLLCVRVRQEQPVSAGAGLHFMTEHMSVWRETDRAAIAPQE